MGSTYFDKSFFIACLERLEPIRQYLRAHPEFNSLCHNDCRKLREEALDLHGPYTHEMDLSLGKYIRSVGGPTRLANMKIYAVNESLAAVTFIHIMNIKENRAQDPTVWPVTIPRCVSYIKIIFSTEKTHPDDTFGLTLKGWSDKIGLQLPTVIDLIERELGPDITEHFDDVCFILRCYARMRKIYYAWLPVDGGKTKEKPSKNKKGKSK